MGTTSVIVAELSTAILWYVLTAALGWLVFPLTFRLLPALPERGYTASRALGLLLWGYIFWLLASLGILNNNQGSLVFAGLLLAVLSGWALRGENKTQILAWLRQNRRLALVTEMIFLAAFVAWAIVRAANPETLGTEKPMELAFINAILGSPTFPPHDPWLSGYAISYYYFGYVIVAMLASLTGASGGVAFNLGIALVFALSATGAYGLVYNLLAAHRARQAAAAPDLEDDGAPGLPSLAAPLLGPIFILLVSNLEGFLHSLHNRGLFWQKTIDGTQTSAFWKWLDIKDLNLPPQGALAWVPDQFWWWWRASRVLQDYDLANNPKEIINEFPFFSYLLGDLHPHVLAMPFALLAVALALNILLGGGKSGSLRLQRVFNLRPVSWAATAAIPVGLVLFGAGILRLLLPTLAAGVLVLLGAGYLLVRMSSALLRHGIDLLVHDNLGTVEIGRTFQLSRTAFVLAAVVLGGMAFLNTWDFPFYVALFAAAYTVELAISERRPLGSLLADFFWLAVILGVSGVVLYLPFYAGFASQAGGILPNLIYPTRGAHLWVMFAPLLIPILVFVAYLLRQDARRMLDGFKLATGLIFLLMVGALLLGFAIVVVPGVGKLFLDVQAAPTIDALFQAALQRRFSSPGGWLTLWVLLSLALAALLRVESPAQPQVINQPPEAPSENPAEMQSGPAQNLPARLPIEIHPSHSFALLLILLGALLVIGPEFFFLRDQFGWRMNTIFKFYFQAWLLWAIAAAYASAVLLQSLRRVGSVLFGLGWVILISMSLVYPFFSLWGKTDGFKPVQWTLDGSAYMNGQAPDEAIAIQWLQSAPFGILAEAVPASGGSYTTFARFATLSGKPGVLGWFGHESQWRGGGELLSPRQTDLERLYCLRDWKETQAILDRYHIRYVIVSGLERSTYKAGLPGCPSGVVETKLANALTVAFQVGQVTIYEYPVSMNTSGQ